MATFTWLHMSYLNLPWAHGVVVSHPLRMRKALGSIPSVPIQLLSLTDYDPGDPPAWRKVFECDTNRPTLFAGDREKTR